MTATRETFGNISTASQAVFYIVAAISVGVFAYGIWRRVHLWRHGQPVGVRQLFTGGVAAALVTIRPGARRVMVEGVLQQRVIGRGLPSRAHAALFAGFLVLFAGTCLLELDHLAAMVSEGLSFHHGWYYVAYEFALDLFGLLFLIGTLAFCIRRWWKPPSVGHRPSDWVVLGLFLAIGVTGYAVEALRIGWQQPVGIGADCSFVGKWLSQIISGSAESSLRTAHWGVWWLHALLVFGFIAMIPYTRLLHLITGPLNLFVAPARLGELRPVTLEQAEADGRIGVSDIRHLNSQQLLSLDACMECGRCDDVCPALASGKPLSPKTVVQDLRRVMERLPGAAADTPLNPHEVIRPESLWSCTACSACVNICPVRVDQLTLILELRRHLASEGGLSGTAATALRRMQSSANPWGLPQSDRANWIQQEQPA